MRTAFLTVLFVVVLAAPAGATDYTVNATHDEGTGTCLDGECTLREAVAAAGPSDRVRLPSDHDYELTEGELVLASDTIVGEDARDTTIEQTTNNQRVFNVASGSNQISGVIITGGSTTSPGGGILVGLNASLTLSESTVRDNSSWTGGGITNFGTLTVVRSTLFDNSAGQPTGPSEGGAIFSAGTTTLRNSTVSGNRATSGEASDSTGGGIYVSSGSLIAESTTIAENTALANPTTFEFRDSAIHRETPGTAIVTLNRTIVAGTSPFPLFGPCEGGPFAGSDNLFEHESCGTPVGDVLLGPLGMNGGRTETHEPLGDSDAIDGGGASCPADDQRGFARPAGAACDIGAVEVDGTAQVADLRVITTVVNDSGGTATAGSFNVHVRRDGIDVAGSPAPGSAQGQDYIGLAVGDYMVTGAATSGYTAQTGGACAAGGAITLGPGDEPACMVTFNDVAPSPGGGNQPPPPPGDDDLPEPETGKTVNVLPAQGTVKVKVPGSNRFRELTEGEQLPVGTIVDTLKGRVTLVAAGGQTADFYGGIFRIGQGKGAKPLTTLTLVEKLTCPKAGKAVAAAKKKKRRLWGDGSGKFRTKGKHSAATVVGTKWLVEDKCTSTLTRVARGRVSVRDFVKKKTVIVRAGKKYAAKARR
jgi:CSLREA domain-containing protein